MRIDRRRLMRHLAWMAAGSAALRGGRGLAGAMSRAQEPRSAASLAGTPDPVREWRGYSSAEMELRYGGPEAARRILGRGAATPAIAAGRFPWKEIRTKLRRRYRDLPRHFIFEYYPWYGTSPWRHWQQWDRVPPIDVAATSMPWLGPYDSLDAKVIERHAEWIRETGVGAINLSWWGIGSYCDRATPLVMDIMAAHDIKVAFHIEPYANDRSRRYHDDILYLVREYGDRRGWDSFLLLRDANGRRGPVFKSFRTILAERIVDCHGQSHVVPDYTPDAAWERQTDLVRRSLRQDFDHVTLLADSLNMNRTRASGFDGVAVYNNFVAPAAWPEHSLRAADRGLLFSFNCNPGFDGIHRRKVPEGSCYVPTPFHPPVGKELDWSREADRERARRAAQRQIRDSFTTTLALQTDDDSINAEHGFFLVYINSFNEWHEGHQFEPARPWASLTAQERDVGYHNARRGTYRLSTLRRLMRKVL